MRSDMFEVIIERPRWGGKHGRGDGAGKGRRAEPRRQQEAATWEPVSQGRGTKHLNENLRPLFRFLRSRLGQPWDAVRSEICALLDTGNAVQMHVRDHVKQMVEENTVLIDGSPHHAAGSRFGGERPITVGRLDGLYVCPRTGTLRMATVPRRRRPPSKEHPDVRRLDDAHEVRRIEGVWYLITLAPVPAPGSERARCRDVVLGALLGEIDEARLHRTYGRRDRYGAVKKQLGSQEVRVLGLRASLSPRGARLPL